MRQTKQYDKEYKEQAVKLAQQIGTKKAAEELGIPTGTLSGWLYKARSGAIELKGERTPNSAMSLTEEIQQLREAIKKVTKENARLKEENEILAEATAFFASSRRKSEKRNG